MEFKDDIVRSPSCHKGCLVDQVTCGVCPRGCRLAEGEWGFCGVLAVQNGSIRDMYHSAIAWPGIQVRRWNNDTSSSFAGLRGKRVAEVYLPGCNLKCDFCIAPYLIDVDEVRGIRWIEATELVRTNAGSIDALGFAGGEASIHVDYVADVFSQCLKQGVETYIETNGYMTRGTAEKLAKCTNYVVFGLKASLDPAYYRSKLGVAETVPIREAVKVFAKSGCEVRLTNLTDPNLWDDRQAFESLTKWIAQELGAETSLVLGSLERGEMPPPWTDERIHVTPREQREAYLERYQQVAREAGLHQVFLVVCSPRVGQTPPTPRSLAPNVSSE
jgi:pyruvate formate lyase activating enzyme